jgi:TolA-binding protein
MVGRALRIFSRRSLVCAALLLGPAVGLFGQDSSSKSQGNGAELAALYTQGMAAFQAGNYPVAASTLESLLNKAEFSPQLEPAYFTVGSAWFNVPDYKKAVAAFKTYQSKFPNGAHAGEAAFAIAQANLLAKNYSDAASQFAALEKDPNYRERALYFGAIASRDGGKPDQAIATLEKLGELRTQLSIRGAIMLTQLYSKKNESTKTIALIKKMHEHIGMVDDIVELNSTTVELGDSLFKAKAYGDALECYKAAYPREEIVKLQTDRINAMQRKIDENLAAARLDTSQFAQLAGINSQLKADITRIQQMLDQFQKLPTITPAIYIRLARCFYEVDRKWEAILVYQEIIDRYPKEPEYEPALFGLIASLAEVNQAKKAEQRCQEYLRDFKNGPNAETVGYLLGSVALQANDPQTAETHLGRMLESQPKSALRDQMRYLLANAKFMEGKYDDATSQYRQYLTDFPKGQNVEDVNYRLALSALFAGKYQDAMNLLNDYLKNYSTGQYVSDAKYRMAVCKYAATNPTMYDEVIKDCQAWEREFPKNQQLGEVLALLADAQAASGRDNDAVPVYIRSYKIAATDEVMNYSLFAASKLLQKKGEWEKIGELFAGFLEDKPDSPTVISALYWIGKAKAHEGKMDEAKKITADTIKKYIDQPDREALELLLTQLAQMCVKKKKPVESEASAKPVLSASPTDSSVAATASASPSPTVVAEATVTPAPETDPGAELDALLGSTENDQNGTARARVIYAKAELARLRRQPAEEDRNVAKIAEFKPEDLSPVLLGRAGDYLLGKGKLDQAKPFYDKLMEDYPKSDYLDYAYNGLGEIAFQKKDLQTALRDFTDGTTKIAASQKMKDLTVGQAKTLLALNRLDEAKKVFEQVASVREWRGESTAYSVYSLGDIEARRQHWAEANAYFQRVYVGYQKFLPWVAKAYIRSAECFEKLNKQKEAANTYRELLRNEKLAAFGETEEAKKRLAAMGQQG